MICTTKIEHHEKFAHEIFLTRKFPNLRYEYLLAGMILVPEYNMPTVASKFKVELANLALDMQSERDNRPAWQHP